MAANGTKTEGGTVTVAVKSPNGYHLRIFEMRKVREPVMGGGFREVDQAFEVGERITVKGYAAPQGMSPEVPVVGGYALNHNVNADHWHAWLAQNKELPAVRNGLIFAYPTAASAIDAAKDGQGIRSGLERMQQDVYDPETGVLVSRDPRAARPPNLIRAA